MPKLSTQLVQMSAPDSAQQRPLTTPIVQTTTFVIDAELDAAMAKGDYRSQYLYTRMGNPTVRALERRLALLHGHGCDFEVDAVATSSGMAALSSALFALSKAGQTIVADTQLYGVTMSLLDGYIAAAGRNVVTIDFADTQALARTLAATPEAVLLCETLSNPLVRALDLPGIARLANTHGATLLVDNTFANPLVCRPLEFGAHVVIESLSKSIAGHSDVHGGAICGDSVRVAACWNAMLHLGSCLDPHAASLILRGSKTLHVRTQAMQESAHTLARRLRDHPDVSQTYYPFAPPAHLGGGGTVLSFVVLGGDAGALQFLRALQIAVPATSLGGVESLVCCPFNTSHRSAESRGAVGLLAGTVRYSVGCEHVDDLWDDICAALRVVNEAFGEASVTVTG